MFNACSFTLALKNFNSCLFFPKTSTFPFSFFPKNSNFLLFHPKTATIFAHLLLPKNCNLSRIPTPKTNANLFVLLAPTTGRNSIQLGEMQIAKVDWW
jgi:hypothetical protein